MKCKIKDHNNNEFLKFIETLSAHENANYSLWKATNKIKKPIKLIPAIRKADNTWTRSNEEKVFFYCLFKLQSILALRIFSNFSGVAQ